MSKNFNKGFMALFFFGFLNTAIANPPQGFPPDYTSTCAGVLSMLTNEFPKGSDQQKLVSTKSSQYLSKARQERGEGAVKEMSNVLVNLNTRRINDRSGYDELVLKLGVQCVKNAPSFGIN